MIYLLPHLCSVDSLKSYFLGTNHVTIHPREIHGLSLIIDHPPGILMEDLACVESVAERRVQSSSDLFLRKCVEARHRLLEMLSMDKMKHSGAFRNTTLKGTAPWHVYCPGVKATRQYPDHSARKGAQHRSCISDMCTPIVCNLWHIV